MLGPLVQSWPGSVVRIATGYGLDGPGDRIPVAARFFRTRLDRTWGPSSLQYSEYRISFPGVKRPGRGVTAHIFSAKVIERVEPYLYFSTGPLWPVLG